MGEGDIPAARSFYACATTAKRYKRVIRFQWFSVGSVAVHRCDEHSVSRRLLSLRLYRKFVLLNPVACKVTGAEWMTVAARR